MYFKKIGYIADSTVAAQRKLIDMGVSRRDWINIINCTALNKDIGLIIVIGGDGFMLKTIHHYINENVYFYGVNAGTVGFLMNSLDLNNIADSIASAHIATINPLLLTTIDDKGRSSEALAINEISLMRATNQTAKIKIVVDGIIRMEQMIGDGLIISTSIGSTAYNFAAGGFILPFDSKILALTPVCPFRPRRWKGALITDDSEVKLEIVERLKRPVNAVADFIEFKYISSAIVKKNTHKEIKILFNHDQSISEKLLQEQFSV